MSEVPREQTQNQSIAIAMGLWDDIYSLTARYFSRLCFVGSTPVVCFNPTRFTVIGCELEAQPGVEPGYETVPRPCVAIPPPGRNSSYQRVAFKEFTKLPNGYRERAWSATAIGYRRLA
jgi:hypothetical protein